jgi:plasmid rolling circle replication initiator protein Rep
MQILNFNGDVKNVTINIYTTSPPLPQAGNDTQDTQRAEFAEESPLVDKINGKVQPWRYKKGKSIALANAMHELGQNKRANRVFWCSDVLHFAQNIATGQKKLVSAGFCRERLCVMCSWRRSIKTFYRLSRVMDFAQDAAPDLVPLFITLTVRNASGPDLGNTLDFMFKGWKHMCEHRKVRKAVHGWFRALEVTYNKAADTYHPHFHAILMVDKSYFTDPRQYLHQHDWLHIWRTSCKLDYAPGVCIQAVRIRGEREYSQLAEVTKYTTEDADYIQDSQEDTMRVVDVLGSALRNRRLFAFGGVLKKIAMHLKADRPEDGDLVNIDEDATIRNDVAQALIEYKWDFGLRDYFRRT